MSQRELSLVQRVTTELRASNMFARSILLLSDEDLSGEQLVCRLHT